MGNRARQMKKRQGEVQEFKEKGEVQEFKEKRKDSYSDSSVVFKLVKSVNPFEVKKVKSRDLELTTTAKNTTHVKTAKNTAKNTTHVKTSKNTAKTAAKTTVKTTAKTKTTVPAKKMEDKSEEVENTATAVQSDAESDDIAIESESDVAMESDVVESTSEDEVLEDAFDDIQSESEEEEDVKVKSMFADSDDEEDDGDKQSSSDQQDSETEFEKQARLEDEQEALDRIEGEKEMIQNIEERERLILPDIHASFDENEEQQATEPTDLSVLQSRISEVIRILSSFKTLADPTKSRSDYTQLLIADLAAYYGYNTYLATLFYHLFPLGELVPFFEANEVPRPVVVRCNTLKTRRRELAQSLISRGVNLEPIGKWSKVGIQVFDSPVPIGATPEYLAGHYMLQSASSFLPCMALAPQPSDKVLDMCAAPGGKTTYLAQMMMNGGVVVANDVNRDRMKALVGNIHRLGVRNTIVSNNDGRLFPGIGGGFDRVLLDAPCSGTGVISKDASVKTNKSESDIAFLTHTQKELVLSAIDSLKVGGTLVYSTCALTVEENEGVVAYALKERPEMGLVDPGLAFGVEGFTAFRGKVFVEEMKLCRRYYPHTHNMDGFFVAKLVKRAAAVTAEDRVETGKFGRKLKKKKGANAVAPSGAGVEKSQVVEEVAFDDAEDAAYLDFTDPSTSTSSSTEPKKQSAPKPKPTKKRSAPEQEEEEVVEKLSRAEKKARKRQAMERLGL